MKNKTRHIAKVAFGMLLATSCNTASAQTNNVGIGTNSPDASAILELQATDKGILIPRTDTNLVIAPATGLLIYETADNTFYYFDGTYWVAFGSGTPGPPGADGALNAWSLTGNSGTSPPTNFIGTTDANDWVIQTNGSERVRVMSGGRIGVNMSAPVYQLDVLAPTYGIRSETTGLLTTSIYGHNSNATNGYGIAGQADGSSPFTSVGVKGIAENGGDALQTDGPSHFNVDGQDFNFQVEGLTDVNLFYGDAGNDRIGIGTASPSEKLDVVGNVEFSGSLEPNALPGNTGQALLSAGANTAPTWGPDLTGLGEISVWIYPPTDLNNNTTYQLTGTVPGCTSTSAVSVNLLGDWTVSPGNDITIHHVEARTGAVRFIVENNSNTITYLGMDFVISIIR